jgi:Amidohydrolase family
MMVHAMVLCCRFPELAEPTAPRHLCGDHFSRPAPWPHPHRWEITLCRHRTVHPAEPQRSLSSPAARSTPSIRGTTSSRQSPSLAGVSSPSAAPPTFGLSPVLGHVKSSCADAHCSPGFIDAHCHLTGLGMAMASIDCKALGMQSIEALQKAVYERAATQPPGTWIRGRGYDQTRLREGRHPNHDDWDTVAPNHPVISRAPVATSPRSTARPSPWRASRIRLPTRQVGDMIATGAATSVWPTRRRKHRCRWPRCRPPRSLVPRSYVPMTPISPLAVPVCMTPVV